MHNSHEDKRAFFFNEPDMSLLDENPGVVNGLGHPGFEDERLKAALEEILDGEGEDVIELVLSLVEESVAEHSAEKSLALEDPARVLLVEGEEVPRVVADAAERVLHPPQLSLAPKPVLTNQLQLRVETLLLVRTTRLLECLPI